MKTLMGCLVHASDIGNGVTTFNTYISWSALVIQEFNYQVVVEERNQLKPTEMFRYKGEKAFYKGQIFFLSKSL